MADYSLPERRPLLERRPDDEPTGTPTQLAFRQTIRAVEALREQLHALRTAQGATRQTYWRQVGPLAADTVAARRALYAPLEAALLGGYLSRAEEAQVTELLLHNAQSLQERFGEDESAMLARYAPAPPPPAPEPATTSQPPEPKQPPHEQAAATARERRQQRAQAARAAQTQQADAAGQALLQNTKVAYRQLARLHHPDRAALADAATQQAQTELMQRITAAYAASDLAALLALLAEAPAAAPTAETEELLGRYTQALTQQQAHLSQQLAAAQHPLADAPWSGTEKQQRTRLRETKRSLRAETEYLAYLLRQLQEPIRLKELLRELTANGQHGL